MMGFRNGKGRDIDDWKDLLKMTHQRFHLKSIREPPGSRLAITEVIWLDHEIEAHIERTGGRA